MDLDFRFENIHKEDIYIVMYILLLFTLVYFFVSTNR